jgi:hypothetical protein
VYWVRKFATGEEHHRAGLLLQILFFAPSSRRIELRYYSREGYMRIPVLISPVIAGCLFLTTPNNTEAPGPQNFRRLYGEPTMERFAAPSGITVTVQYGPDRLACQLLIEAQQLLVEVKEQTPYMNSEAVSETLQTVVPADTRGEQISTDKLDVQGKHLFRTDYENLSIRRFCTIDGCSPSNQSQEAAALVVFNRSSCPKHLK